MRTRIHRIAAVVAVAMGLCLSLAATASADLTAGLALYCDMEDTNAINVDKVVPDVYGTPLFPGAITGNITQAVDATRGNVLSINTRSTGNYVSFGDNLDPGNTSYTVSLWLKRDNLDATEFPLAKGNSGTSAEAWSFGLRAGSHASGPGMSVRANFTGDSTNRLNTTTPATETDPGGRVEAGQWYHFAMVINQETGHFYAYVNGIGSGEDGDNDIWDCNEGSYSVTFTPDGSADFDTAVPLFLGLTASSATSGKTGAFLGDIDDLAIWTRALSTAEIQAIAGGAAIVPEPGVLALLAGIALFGFMSRGGRKA